MVDFKKFLPDHDKEKKEYFWSLIIEPGWVQAAVWRIVDEKAQIITVSPPAAWESEGDLVNVTDAVLSASVQNFPEEASEPEKCVFGMTSSWVLDGEIKESYLGIIKEVCGKLSLTPVGFVVLSEAIAHFIKSEEGSPTSSIIIGIFKETIEISVFRLGRPSGGTAVARSLSVVEDVIEGLTRLASEEMFPSRFIIYDARDTEIEDVKQTLLKANWDDLGEVRFLHTPKIEEFSSEKKVAAVALAGASEFANVSHVEKVTDKPEVSPSVEESKDWIKNSASTEVPPLLEEMGFVLDKDITEIKTHQKDLQISHKEVAESGKEPPRDKSSRRLGEKIFRFAKDGGRRFVPKIDKTPFVFGAIFFILIFVAGFSFWWFYPKAEITVFISPKKLKEDIEIVIDPRLNQASFAEKILPAEILEAVVSGEKTKDTTGTKTVGEKASGKVTLYRVGSEVKLASGTRLIGPNNLQFTLDSEVAVASGSAGTPGIAEVSVKASDIGAQHNLAGGTSFRIQDYSSSDMEAKNASSFSGGASRDISAVSSEDREKLQEELSKELKDKAKSNLLANLSDDDVFIEETLSATVSSSTFSAKVGDEASNLKLALSLGVEALAVKRQLLFQIAKEALKEKIPENFVLKDEEVEVDFEFEERVGNSYKLNAFVAANLLPEVDKDRIKKVISGKHPALIRDFLVSEIPGFVKAEIGFNKPKFPGKLGTLPKISKNISIELTSEKNSK